MSYRVHRKKILATTLKNNTAVASAGSNVMISEEHPNGSIDSFIHSFIVFIKTSDKTQMKLQE